MGIGKTDQPKAPLSAFVAHPNHLSLTLHMESSIRGQYPVKPRKVGHLSFVQSEDPETLTNAHNWTKLRSSLVGDLKAGQLIFSGDAGFNL